MPDDMRPDEKTPEVRSPSDTLIWCMEDFGASEPERVFVVYVNKSGELCWSSSGPYSYTHIIGMLDCARNVIMQKFMELNDH